VIEQLVPAEVFVGRVLEGLAFIRACAVDELLAGYESSGDVEIDSNESAWVLSMLNVEFGRRVNPRTIPADVLISLRRLSRLVAGVFPEVAP
jgi:hypothetical protein